MELTGRDAAYWNVLWFVPVGIVCFWLVSAIVP